MKRGFGAAWQDLRATARRQAEREGLAVHEVWLWEPGLRALARHRFAHWLWSNGFRGWSRWMAGWTRRATGIDIHPGARIGRRCVFVAGGGVVIGETAVIGDDCLIEPGVMLLAGGLAVTRDATAAIDVPAGLGIERAHPSIGRRVILEGGAVLVGDVFVGDDVRVHAGATVTRDVKDGAIVVGSPGRVLSRTEVNPDPDARAMQAIADRFYRLEEQVQVMAFKNSRQPGEDAWRTRNPEHYGPIAAVEALIDGAGI